jgi:hypothetical protein
MAHIEHHLPTPEEAQERGHMRRAASDRAQTGIWIWFLASLAVLIALGVAWGVSSRISAPRAPQLDPDLPALPGLPPQPQPK